MSDFRPILVAMTLVRKKDSAFYSFLSFLLAAAWVDPGRSALQSAEQRCQRRYGRIHQVGSNVNL